MALAPHASVAPPRATSPHLQLRGATRLTLVAILGLLVGVGGALALVATRSGGSSKTRPGLEGSTVQRPAGSEPRRIPGARQEPQGGCGTVDLDNPPVIAFKMAKESIDFGTVKQGSQHHTDIAFENRGRSELCILKVYTGCGCLEARLVPPGKNRFAPGEGGVIRVVIDTHDREGIVQKDVSITSNDLDRPLVQIPAQADVSRAVVAAPVAVRFGSVARASPTTGVVFLRSPKTDPAWEVTGIRGSWRQSDGKTIPYTFTVDEVEDARYRRFKVTIAHPGILKEGNQRDPLVITTTHPERTQVVIQSFISVVQRITPKPQRAALGYVRSGGSSRTARVRLESGIPGASFKIVEARAEALTGDPVQGLGITHGVDGACPTSK